MIVDEKAAARRSVRRMLRPDAEVTVVGEYDRGAGAAAAIRRLQPELLFLDIALPDIDGVSLFKELGPTAPPTVVFTSHSDCDAVRAFEVHATGYLLKPLSEDRFRATLQSAKRKVWESRVESWGRQGVALLRGARQERDSDAPDTDARHAILMVAVSGEGRLLLDQKDVSWVGADRDHVCVHVGRTQHVVRSTLESFTEQLNPHWFARIHRSTIVNLQQVRRLERFYRAEYIVILADGTRLKVSRRYHAPLESRLASL